MFHTCRASEPAAELVLVGRVNECAVVAHQPGVAQQLLALRQPGERHVALDLVAHPRGGLVRVEHRLHHHLTIV